MASWVLLFDAAILFGVSVGMAQGDVRQDKSSTMLNSWLTDVLQSIPGQEKPQLEKTVPIDDETLREVFPGDRFYGVYFRTRPRVFGVLPRELSPNTVVRVRGAETVEPIPDEEALRTFLARALGDIRDEGRAKAAALAALRLAEGVASAGSSSFAEPQVSVVREGENIVATARAAVQAPGRGEVAIRIEFGADGKIKPDAIKIDDRSHPGPPS